MKKNDLLSDDLLDSGVEVGKKVLGGYEKAQTWLWYLVVAKWVAIAVVVGGILIGGAYFVSGMKDMVTDAVVTEVKEVAAEKTAEVKAAAREKVASAKEKAKGHSMSDLGGAFAKFKMGVEEKYNEAVDGALVEQGYHPDAPAYCVGNNDENNKMCSSYTNEEIDGATYRSISALWGSACPDAEIEILNRLKMNGKITKNDYRMLDNKCVDEMDSANDRNRDDLKQRMMDEAGR